MNIENFEKAFSEYYTANYRYGFGKLTQDEFCTAILIMLGIISICQICILCYFISKSNQKNKEENDN